MAEREIVLKRLNASLEWLLGRIALREKEMEQVVNGEMEEGEKIKAKNH